MTVCSFAFSQQIEISKYDSTVYEFVPRARPQVKMKALSFQVAATAIDYKGLKYGFGIGMNYKQIFSLNYFHTRDYDTKETYMDNRFAGVYASLVFPVCGGFEIGGGVRKGTLNMEWQKMHYGGEIRYKFNDKLRIAYEQGFSGDHKATSLKLIVNLY